MLRLYARATGWLCVPNVERRIALLAFVLALPSLSMGLHVDDYFLRNNLLQRGPLAAYSFVSRDPQAAHARLLEERTAGRAPWWADEHPRASFFRPLSSLSLWLDFSNGAPLWWMHLQNCVIYAVSVWLAIALYRQLGLSDAGLGWTAVFFGLDAPVAQSAGWIAGRDTLLAVCFGLACILIHDRARRAGRPLLLALAGLCFALSLLSAELGLCTLGYLSAHALSVDRGSPAQRVLALVPYGLVTGGYLAHYVSAGYGFSDGGIYRDVMSAPGAAALAWLGSLPVWLATTVSLPVASFQLLVPDLHLPLLVFSLGVLAVVLPLLGPRAIREPHERMFAIGAVLSLVPLAATLPQERLRFFVAFGVFGLLGPWIAGNFEARGRLRRTLARSLWRVHGVWLPLLFVPFLFSISSLSKPVHALDQALPRASAPIAILLNPPLWAVPTLLTLLRSTRGEVAPPVFALYAGSQPLEIQRVDERSLELHNARSWFATPFEQHVRNVAHAPFRNGDRIAIAHCTVEVREVDPAGAPTRVRFTFERSLDDRELAFHCWQGSQLVAWKPPPIGGRVQLLAAGAF